MTYVAITLVVLLFLNVYCWEISKKVFYQNEQTAMLEKAYLTSNEIAELDVLSMSGVSEIVKKLGDMRVTRLMVTDSRGLIIYDTGSSIPLESYALFPQILIALDGKDIFTWYYENGEICSQAAVPIMHTGNTIGCVYMMEYNIENGQLLSSLRSNIFKITLVLELLITIFSLLYAHRFSGRLRKIMSSMQIIQTGDYSHKVSMGGHDELTFLGQEFNDLTERLQTSETKRRQFVSDASHELKTPLASIKLLSDSILQYDMDMDTVKEFVSDIGNEADRLNRMTQKLLSLTKGECNSEDDEKEIICIAPTIDRVIRMLSGIAAANGITITQELESDAPILVQEDDLYQILFNLIENGIKYNHPSGKLNIHLRRDEDIVSVSVTDTGVGIPPDAIDHIFERFYRVDKARSRQSGGSGLGLSIVRSMVRRNNGEIHVKSTPGKGTTFMVEFPCFDTEVDEI